MVETAPIPSHETHETEARPHLRRRALGSWDICGPVVANSARRAGGAASPFADLLTRLFGGGYVAVFIVVSGLGR
jgi:hypothetical protein